MIIWLASYPRSGNTLLRTIFKQTMGLSSYSDEIMLPSIGHTDLAKQTYGNRNYEGSWDSFYYQASNSKETFLIKTHLPPCDDQPAIYVVRDGRAATESYATYHSSFTKDLQTPPSILELMLGDDYYGDWASHYRAWNSRGLKNLLQVRFEELVNADEILLGKLKAFVDFDGEVRPFENPRNELHSENPNFFRSGHTDWLKGKQWPEKLEYIFIALHGDLLIELSYIQDHEKDLAVKKLNETEISLIGMANKGFIQRNSIRHDAFAKEKVIKQLLDKKIVVPHDVGEKNWLGSIFSLKRRGSL